MPMGPTQQYLCQYNGIILPGYVQSESFDSTMNIAQHYGPYIDGSPSEEMGLANKALNVVLKVWETDYLTCKQQVEYASTVLRSMRTNFANLYLQFNDRHYSAMVKGIRTSKQAGLSYRTLDYEVEFECKPWLISDTLRQFSGTGTVATTGRTIESNGGWTPTVITSVSATNLTISGTDGFGATVGNLQMTGSVTNLTVDTEAFTAIDDTGNVNDQMVNADYRIFVGPGVTTFSVTGGSVTFSYYDRWYI